MPYSNRQVEPWCQVTGAEESVGDAVGGAAAWELGEDKVACAGEEGDLVAHAYGVHDGASSSWGHPMW